MRGTDERCAAVRRRTAKLRRRRTDHVLAVLICLMAIPLVDLAGRTAANVAADSSANETGLFGAASLFGSSIGGYVLVALVAAVVAVLITVLCIRRYRASKEEDVDEDKAFFVDDAGNQMRRSEIQPAEKTTETPPAVLFAGV